jgi:hypothetical protein
MDEKLQMGIGYVDLLIVNDLYYLYRHFRECGIDRAEFCRLLRSRRCIRFEGKRLELLFCRIT